MRKQKQAKREPEEAPVGLRTRQGEFHNTRVVLSACGLDATQRAAFDAKFVNKNLSDCFLPHWRITSLRNRIGLSKSQASLFLTAVADLTRQRAIPKKRAPTAADYDAVVTSITMGGLLHGEQQFYIDDYVREHGIMCNNAAVHRRVKGLRPGKGRRNLSEASDQISIDKLRGLCTYEVGEVRPCFVRGCYIHVTADGKAAPGAYSLKRCVDHRLPDQVNIDNLRKKLKKLSALHSISGGALSRTQSDAVKLKQKLSKKQSNLCTYEVDGARACFVSGGYIHVTADGKAAPGAYSLKRCVDHRLPDQVAISNLREKLKKLSAGKCASPTKKKLRAGKGASPKKKKLRAGKGASPKKKKLHSISGGASRRTQSDAVKQKLRKKQLNLCTYEVDGARPCIVRGCYIHVTADGKAAPGAYSLKRCVDHRLPDQVDIANLRKKLEKLSAGKGASPKKKNVLKRKRPTECDRHADAILDALPASS